MKVLHVLCLAFVVVGAYAKSCSSEADCTDAQCCLRPLYGGKRFIFGDNVGYHAYGICTSLSLKGERCESPEIHDPFNPRIHEFYCPCVKGFECHDEKEMHQSGNHGYIYPKCFAAGSITDAPGTSA